MWMHNPMGNYTLEIGQIIKHGGVIFDFDYPFYDESHRKEFERKFLLHFRYNEIGQETLQRFKYMLQDTLTMNHEKYLHFYKTKMKSQELQWWNNKDYHTEYSRELNKVDNSNNISNSSSSNSDSYENEGHNNTSSTSRFLDTPQGNVDNVDDGYATNVTKDNSNDNVTSLGVSSGTATNNSTSTNNRNGRDTETIITNEYGNIGTTSSGDLVKSWLEDAYINVDLLIMNDCEELFMQVY